MNAINVESPKKKESLGMRIKEEFRRNYMLYLFSIPVIAYFVTYQCLVL